MHVVIFSLIHWMSQRLRVPPRPSLLQPPLAFRRTVERGGHCHTFPQYSQPTPTHPARTAPIRPVARRVCRATACHSRWRCTIRRRTCRTGYVYHEATMHDAQDGRGRGAGVVAGRRRWGTLCGGHGEFGVRAMCLRVGDRGGTGRANLTQHWSSDLDDSFRERYDPTNTPRARVLCLARGATTATTTGSPSPC